MKLTNTIFVIVFSLIAGLTLAVAAQNRTVLNEAQKVTRDRFTVAAVTPRGARIYAVNKPNAQMLGAIDQGLTELFAVSRKSNYGKRLNYADYTIFIARADRTEDANRQYSPDIAIGAAQYAGSIYDQGGYVYAAGMVIAYNPCAFVIAEHDRNLRRVSDVVRFEGEHLVLYHNDRRLYNQTADHSRGGGHPILQ